jgi:hypothetical protein
LTTEPLVLVLVLDEALWLLELEDEQAASATVVTANTAAAVRALRGLLGDFSTVATPSWIFGKNVILARTATGTELAGLVRARGDPGESSS